ncbi:hypothetical protein PIB30_034070 [Stylosanthes scabra]|uniref:TF-B3 domain-containing protein n=1 Tax=Stylosanthes scabra TaxID=79078 RepID=A0ABU6Z9K5_9FABA|nr:hypothetical protein [Stylosanthes scabra]
MASSASQQNNHSASTVIRFLKIVLKKSLQDGTLKVPKKFSKKYGDGLPNPVYIKPPDGTEWKIDWTKQDGEVLFEKGWKEFAKYYSLDNGHLLWFEYNGTSEIEVHILDPSCLEIDYPPNDNLVGMSKKQQRQKRKVKAEPKPSTPSRSKRLKRTAKTADEEGSPDTLNWKQNANSEEETKLKIPARRRKRPYVDAFKFRSDGFRSLKAAQNFKSENPSFMIQITHPSILKKAAAIPIPFFTKYFAKKKLNMNINIRMGSKLLPVKLLYYPSFRAAYISAGWQTFAVASNLKAGDVCIFELPNEQDQLLDVHIYRAGRLSIL